MSTPAPALLTSEGAEAAGVPTEPAVPSVPKQMIDAFLDEYRFHTILPASAVHNLLLDLRHEV